MAFKDLTFRLFGEDKSASDSLTHLSNHAESVSGRIGRGFAGLGKIVGGLGLAAAAAAAAGAATIVATGIGEAMDASKGVAQLEAGLKSTNNVAGVSVKHMEDLAGSIQGMSGQTDDSIVSAQSLLLTFTNIRNSGPDKIFDQATRATADMAARMGGDASSNAVRLGKALNDPIKGVSALAKVGVSFDESQKKSIKAMVEHGDVAKAQKVILGELNKEFGGSAKAAGESLPGQLERSKRAFEDVSQTVVETILPVVTPAIEGIAGAVKKAEPFLTSMAEVVRDKLGAGLKIVGDFVGPLFDQLGSGATGTAPKLMTLAQSVGDHLSEAFKKIGPAIGPILKQLPGIFEAILPAVVKLWSTIVDGVGQVVPPLMGIVRTVLPAVIEIFKTLYPAVAEVFSGVIAAVAPLLQLLQVILPPIIQGLLAYIVPIFQGIVSVISGALKVVQGVIQTVLGVITGNWSLAWDGLKNIVGGLLDVILGLLRTAAAPFIAAFQQLTGKAGDLLKKFGDGAADVFGWFQKLPERIGGWLAGAAKWLVDTGHDVLDGLLDGAKKGLLAFGQWEVGIAEKVIGWLAGAAKWLVDTGHDVLDGLISGAKTGLIALGRWEMSIGEKVIGWLAGAGKWLVDTGTDILQGLAAGARAGWSFVTKFLGSVPDKVRAGLDGAASWLKGIGGDVIDGLVQGIRDSAGLVITAAKNLANLLPEWARKVLDIHSPSRVFREIGKFVGQGLVQGVDGTADQVASSMTSLKDKITSAFDKLGDQREASQKRLKKLDEQLGDVSTATAAGRKRAAALQRMISDEKSTLREIATAKAGKSALLKTLETDTAALAKLATRRDALATQLKAAQDNLASATKTRDDYASSITSGAIDAGSAQTSFATGTQLAADARSKADDLASKLSGLDSSISDADTDRPELTAKIAAAQADRQSAIDAIAAAQGGDDLAAAQADQAKADSDLVSLTRQLREFDQKVVGYHADRAAVADQLVAAQAQAAKSPVQLMVETLQDQVGKTTEFNTLLAQLRSQGLDDTTYAQIAGAGVTQGLSTAQALAADGGGAVAQISVLQGKLNTAASALGQSTSTTLYQAGVDLAQAGVDGIQSKVDAVTGAMGVVEQNLAKAVGKLGVNTSALSRKAGQDVALGLKQGIEDKHDALDKVFKHLSKSMVTQLKKALGIKSPSTVFRDEVGVHIPAGVVEGVRAGAGAVDREVAAMVNVPRYATAPGSTGLPGQIPTADGGQKSLVHIENFHATPEQSPADIAADLGWLARGGL